MNCSNCGREFNNIKIFPVHCTCGTKVYDDGSTTVKPPPLTEKIKNFSASAIKHAKNRFKKVPEEVSNKRYEICKSCPLYDVGSDSCKKCGCRMSVKTTWATESCPISKWDKYEEDSDIQ
jgi:DNA-directed RNA polymerase subunit RPC12/RpoP